VPSIPSCTATEFPNSPVYDIGDIQRQNDELCQPAPSDVVGKSRTLSDVHIAEEYISTKPVDKVEAPLGERHQPPESRVLQRFDGPDETEDNLEVEGQSSGEFPQSSTPVNVSLSLAHLNDHSYSPASSTRVELSESSGGMTVSTQSEGLGPPAVRVDGLRSPSNEEDSVAATESVVAAEANRLPWQRSADEAETSPWKLGFSGSSRLSKTPRRAVAGMEELDGMSVFGSASPVAGSQQEKAETARNADATGLKDDENSSRRNGTTSEVCTVRQVEYTDVGKTAPVLASKTAAKDEEKTVRRDAAESDAVAVVGENETAALLPDATEPPHLSTPASSSTSSSSSSICSQVEIFRAPSFDALEVDFSQVDRSVPDADARSPSTSLSSPLCAADNHILSESQIVADEEEHEFRSGFVAAVAELSDNGGDLEDIPGIFGSTKTVCRTQVCDDTTETGETVDPAVDIAVPRRTEAATVSPELPLPFTGTFSSSAEFESPAVRSPTCPEESSSIGNSQAQKTRLTAETMSSDQRLEQNYRDIDSGEVPETERDETEVENKTGNGATPPQSSGLSQPVTSFTTSDVANVSRVRVNSADGDGEGVRQKFASVSALRFQRAPVNVSVVVGGRSNNCRVGVRSTVAGPASPSAAVNDRRSATAERTSSKHPAGLLIASRKPEEFSDASVRTERRSVTEKLATDERRMASSVTGTVVLF